MYIGDMRIFEDYVHRFVSYVKENEMNDAPISFVNESGFLYKEEGYKYRIAKEAKAILNCDEWNESWIGDGRIRQRIFKAMGLASNLVNFNSIIDFKNHFDSSHKSYDPDCERVIYDIYRSDNDMLSFEHATNVFGSRYPLIAYLFFVKDETNLI